MFRSVIGEIDKSGVAESERDFRSVDRQRGGSDRAKRGVDDPTVGNDEICALGALERSVARLSPVSPILSCGPKNSGNGNRRPASSRSIPASFPLSISIQSGSSTNVNPSVSAGSSAAFFARINGLQTISSYFRAASDRKRSARRVIREIPTSVNVNHLRFFSRRPRGIFRGVVV